jgi:hypothetical protein
VAGVSARLYLYCTVLYCSTWALVDRHLMYTIQVIKEEEEEKNVEAVSFCRRSRKRERALC